MRELIKVNDVPLGGNKGSSMYIELKLAIFMVWRGKVKCRLRRLVDMLCKSLHQVQMIILFRLPVQNVEFQMLTRSRLPGCLTGNAGNAL